MEAVFKNKKISGILAVLPEKESYFDDEVGNYSFPEKQTMRLKKVMGFNKHRLAKDNSTTSQFCIEGLNHLLNTGRIKKEEIGAVIVVTLSPDHFLPHVSNIIHGECDLSADVFCMDIPQGCCGFLMGLIQAFMLLDNMKDKKVVLFNSDVLSHKVSKHDRNEYPLVGDITTVSIIENTESEEKIISRIFSDGKNRNVLKIEAGGFAMPSTAETAKEETDEEGNIRCLDNLHMDGAEVFNFAQREVPPFIEKMFSDYGISDEDIDYYIFHQPNKFMLKKIADKMQVSYDKMFMNVVEEYGNPSGASISTAIVHNLKDTITTREYNCCLCAFGSGLSWGGIIMKLGNMDFCEFLNTDL